MIFFFSSRRRHTRYIGDWSSDVCSSDLEILRQRQIYAELCETGRRLGSQLILATHSEVVLNEAEKDRIVAFVGRPHTMRQSEIGKASCRERVYISGGAGGAKEEVGMWRA